ncbi:MAG: H-NS histone family protein [Limimaricola sp.]|uniref:H-NS histone family protein n=1 Tax=Limimaricola sp. TaxID=2211665 RepID=UPI001D648799|nr:H-NS histone family protein [Limimaricola sp.]MBI1417699.1 H-NS histone family protein [Limimaricola sp.]
MNIDLDTMSRRELETLRVDIDKALVRVAQREREMARKAAEEAAAAHGFSLAELTGASGRGRAKSASSGAKNPARYRNPANPAETWSGRGRKPGWIKDAEAKGIDISTMEI